MQVTLEKTGELEGRIIVNVTPDDYAEKVTKELKEIGRTHTIPGFRKGHVSVDQLRRRFGREVKSRVLNDEVYRATIKYITDEKVNILGEPLPVELQEINLADTDYKFEYEVGLAPEINAEVTDAITIPYYTIEVTDKLVEEQDKALRERFGAQVPGEEIDEKALVKGSIMELNENDEVRTDEEAIQVIDGIVAPMYFTDKDQAALFIGKKVGDKIRFNPWKTCNGNAAELSSMLHVDKERCADLKADFELAISEIIVLKPAEHNEEFYKEVFPGNDTVKDEEQYYAELRKMIAAQLAPNSEMLFSRDARKVLLETFGNFELPDTFLKKWLVARDSDNLTPENIDERYTEMVPDIKWELIEGQIAKNLDLQITDDDRLQFAKALAYRQFMQYGITNADDETITNFAKRLLEDKESARRMHSEIFNRKFYNAVRAKVTLDQKEVSLDDFKKIVNPEA